MFSISKITAISALALSSSLASAATTPPVGEHDGSATVYHPNGGLSACGTRPEDTDQVAGVSKKIFSQFTGNAACNAFVYVNADGKFLGATRIQELCESCGKEDIILSGAAFSVLADPAVGVIENVNWGIILV